MGGKGEEGEKSRGIIRQWGEFLGYGCVVVEIMPRTLSVDVVYGLINDFAFQDHVIRTAFFISFASIVNSS